MREENYDLAQKVVLIGDSTVGKTQLLRRFTKGTFSMTSTMTIGINVASKAVVVNDKNVNVQIWDTCGQEQFRCVTAPYYREAVGALVVYDITNSDSFHSLDFWLEEVRERGAENISVLIVGNKCDLQDTREVSIQEAKAYAESRNLEMMETSALADVNVQEMFMKLLQKVCDGSFMCTSRQSLSLHSLSAKSPNSSCRC